MDPKEEIEEETISSPDDSDELVPDGVIVEDVTDKIEDEFQPVKTGRITVRAEFDPKRRKVHIQLWHADGNSGEEIYTSRKKEVEELVPKLKEIAGTEEALKELENKLNYDGSHDDIQKDPSYISEKAIVEMQTLIRMNQIFRKRLQRLSKWVRLSFEEERENIENVVREQKLQEFHDGVLQNLHERIKKGIVLPELTAEYKKSTQ